MIKIELAYAPAQDVQLIALSVNEGTTVREAIDLSGLCHRYPDIDPDTAKTGIFGKLCTGDMVLNDGDRIEVYRPLLADPKEARRTRALRQKHTRQ